MSRSPVLDGASFGRWLKRCRHALGLTQETLAERAGYATDTIRKIERGQRRPSYQLAARLAQVLSLSGEERAAFMQAARGAPEELPVAPVAARSSRARVRKLPTYLTPFVGRDGEQAELLRLLATPDHRLITLVGPGGIGKTRLAVEVAAACPGFADGVVFVPLAPLREPHAIVPAIADALAFAFAGTTNLASQLLGYLQDKELLLVLDNLEHLLDTAGSTVGLLRHILAQAPRVTLFVTSRERLKLQAEWVIAIEGLPVPPDDVPHATADYPALALFLEHAQRVQHGFRLSADDARAVAEICRLVEGMPLGLELAAAWVRVLSPQEIGQELMRGLDARLVSPQDLPERHRSLQTVFDQSWRLLSSAERRVLCKLAIFQGGCTRAAAAAVAGASLAVLATLVDKSLLRHSGAGRYDLHELIRQYALARLQEHPQDDAATRDQHSAYYAAWLAEREAQVKGAELALALAEISAEIDNVRAAWHQAVAARRLGDIWRSAETLHWFFEFRGWFREGEALFRQATDALGERLPANRPTAPGSAADNEAEQRRVLGQVLAIHGYLVSRLGRFEAALALIERALAVQQQADDQLGRSRTRAYHGIVAYQMGDYHRSRESLSASLAAAEARHDMWTAAICLTWLSMVQHALGAYDEAERAFREGLARWRTIGNPRTTLFCITFCSITLAVRHKYSEAQALLHESLALSSTTDDRWGMAMTLTHLGVIAVGQGEPHEAVRLFREALDLFRTTGTRWEIARALNHLGAAFSALGLPVEAARSYREALQTAVEAQASPDILQALAGLATLLVRERHYAAALQLVLSIQQHAASRTETRDQAAQLHTALLPHLTPGEISAIAEGVQGSSLAEVAEQALHALASLLIQPEGDGAVHVGE